MKVLLLDERTRDVYLSMISIRHIFSKSGVSLANITINVNTAFVLLSTDLQNSLLRWRAGVLHLHLPDWAKLLGIYTPGTISVPFHSLIAHFYVDEIKDLWHPQPSFNCTHLLYNSISSMCIYILYQKVAWEDGCYSKFREGSFHSSHYQPSLFPCYSLFVIHLHSYLCLSVLIAHSKSLRSTTSEDKIK